MKLTAAQIRCLLAVYSLSKVNEDVASKDVARLLGVSGPSVHRVLGALGGLMLLEKEHYGTAKLTAQGSALAARLEKRRASLVTIFSERYGLIVGEADNAATLLMSGLEEESLLRLESV